MDPVFYSINNWSLSNKNHSTLSRAPKLEALSLPFQTFLILLYSGTAIISFCGNSIVLIVLIKGKKSSTELKKFLINLSLSDICMALLSIPFTYTDFMLGRWIFKPFMCPLASMITICAMCVSVYTLTLIGVDRYYAIIRPLHPSIFLSKRSVLILAFIWLFAIIISSPQLVITKVEPFIYSNQSYVDCREDWSTYGGQLYSEIYSIFLFGITFSLPMIVLTVIYGTIGYNIMRRIPANDAHNDAFVANVHNRYSDQRLKTTIKAVKMMAMVVILFAVCWSPIQVFNIIFWLYGDSVITQTETQMNIYVGSFFICHWLAMAHSAVNPFIYCFMSDNFKEDCKLIWNRCRMIATTNYVNSDSPRNRNGSSFTTNVDNYQQSGRTTQVSFELLPIVKN